MNKAVIFDLDGVICYTDKYHFLAWKKITDKLGLVFNHDINDLLRGVSRSESLEIILRKNNTDLEEELKLKLLDEKNSLYKEYLKNLNEEDMQKGLLEVLTELKNRKYKLAIGSSSRNTLLILDKLNLNSYFDAIVDGNDIKNSKPDKEVFVKAADKLNVPYENCYVIEDAIAGITAGISANMITIALNINEENKANYNINNIKEILDIVK